MYARIAAGHFGSLQVQLGQFPCSGQRLTVRHNLCNHSPFVRGVRRERLWVEQERLRSSRSSAITPRDRKSTRLNSSHQIISYAVFCFKKQNDDMLLDSV